MAALPFGIEDGARLWAVALQASEDFNVTVSLELYQAQLASVLEVLFRCSELSSTAPNCSAELQALRHDLTQLLEDLLQWGKDLGTSRNGRSQVDNDRESLNASSPADLPVSPQPIDDSSALALATFNRRVVALQRKCCSLASAPPISQSSMNRTRNSNFKRGSSPDGAGGGRGGLRRSQSMPDQKPPATPTTATKRVRRVSFSDTVLDRESMTPRPLPAPADDAAEAMPSESRGSLPPRPLNRDAAKRRRPSIEMGGAPLPFLPPPKAAQASATRSNEESHAADAARKASLAALYKTIYTNPCDKGSSAAARRQDVLTLRAAAKAYRARKKRAAARVGKNPGASLSSSSARSSTADPLAFLDEASSSSSSAAGAFDSPPLSPCLEGISRLDALAAAQELEADQNRNLSSGNSDTAVSAYSIDDLAGLPYQRDDTSKIDFAESLRSRSNSGGGGVKQKFHRILEATSLARLFNRDETPPKYSLADVATARRNSQQAAQLEAAAAAAAEAAASQEEEEAAAATEESEEASGAASPSSPSSSSAQVSALLRAASGDLQPFLEDRALESFLRPVLDAGVRSSSALLALDDSTLMAMGLKPIHVKKLRRPVGSYCGDSPLKTNELAPVNASPAEEPASSANKSELLEPLVKEIESPPRPRALSPTFDATPSSSSSTSLSSGDASASASAAAALSEGPWPPPAPAPQDQTEGRNSNGRAPASLSPPQMQKLPPQMMLPPRDRLSPSSSLSLFQRGQPSALARGTAGPEISGKPWSVNALLFQEPRVESAERNKSSDNDGRGGGGAAAADDDLCLSPVSYTEEYGDGQSGVWSPATRSLTASLSVSATADDSFGRSDFTSPPPLPSSKPSASPSSKLRASSLFKSVDNPNPDQESPTLAQNEHDGNGNNSNPDSSNSSSSSSSSSSGHSSSSYSKSSTTKKTNSSSKKGVKSAKSHGMAPPATTPPTMALPSMAPPITAPPPSDAAATPADTNLPEPSGPPPTTPPKTSSSSSSSKRLGVGFKNKGSSNSSGEGGSGSGGYGDGGGGLLLAARVATLAARSANKASPARRSPKATDRAGQLTREADKLRKTAAQAEDKPAALESAASLYALAAEANPSNSAGAHYGRGVCLRKLGRHEEAVACFQAAIKLDPSGSIVGSRPGSVWENLAATYLRLKQPINARDAYAAALELEPGSASLLDGLAKATAKGKSSASANKPPRRTAHV